MSDRATGPARLLVVEDSPTQREELRFLLEQEGYSVVTANDGKEGLAAARAAAFDLVISDVMMPELDGYGLCKAMRADPVLRDVPVVLLTSLADPRDVVRALDAGASNFVRKPFEPEYLLGRVRNVLATAEARKTTPSEMAVTIRFKDKRYSLPPNRLQVLDVLLATYDDALYQLADAPDAAPITARVLLIDDSETQLAHTRFVLEQCGCVVVTASNGKEGLAALRAGPIDLVISDVVMPDMDGYAFCEVVRANGPVRDVPIILLTALRNPADVIAGITAGASNFIRKPFEDEYLAGRVRNLLGETRARASLSVPPPIDTVFADQRYSIGADRVQMLDLLLSSYENAVQQNTELVQTRDELRVLNEQLEARVAERTAALRASEQKYRRIIETANEGVVITDGDHRFSFVSPQAEAIFGYERGELLGKSVLALVGEAELPDVLRGHQRRREGAAESGELRLVRKDGKEVWVYRSSSPIFDDEGQYQGMFAMMMDITAKKSAEESLRRTEKQLHQAQKMEAIGNLAGGVAHDFNNLLSVILSYSVLLAQDMTASDPRRADLLEIEAAGKRAVELTRQLLAFSRQQILEPRVVDLNDIVTGLERMLRRLIGADVELTVLLAPSLGRALVDPGQMEQIVMNLAVNSRDAMPEGGMLTIETTNVELDSAYAAAHVGAHSGPHVMLAVTDTGSGMDKATQSRMFEPFFTTKEKGKGTGLGLATVFGIVQQSGGNIWAYSEPGNGTTFKVYFPRTDAAPSAVHRTTPPLTGPVGGTETILLVEDEDSVRVLACTLLRRFGYHVLEAHSGGDALLICEQHPATIHLLLTDVVMPRMSGRQLSERLQPMRPAMKVLYMSGYTDNSIVHHGVLDSGVAFLQKPITPEALVRKVREVLNS